MSRYSSTLRIRLEPRMAQAIARRARAELISPSEVARRAFAFYLEALEPKPRKASGG